MYHVREKQFLLFDSEIILTIYYHVKNFHDCTEGPIKKLLQHSKATYLKTSLERSPILWIEFFSGERKVNLTKLMLISTFDDALASFYNGTIFPISSIKALHTFYCLILQTELMKLMLHHRNSKLNSNLSISNSLMFPAQICHEAL